MYNGYIGFYIRSLILLCLSEERERCFNSDFLPWALREDVQGPIAGNPRRAYRSPLKVFIYLRTLSQKSASLSETGSCKPPLTTEPTHSSGILPETACFYGNQIDNKGKSWDWKAKETCPPSIKKELRNWKKKMHNCLWWGLIRCELWV